MPEQTPIANRAVPISGSKSGLTPRRNRVDVIYTWVDSHQPEYQAQLHQYANQDHDLNPERFRDDFVFLKYSLRSLEMFFPHADRIFLLTARPQVPNWLALDHPRLRIVHHDELAVPAGVLPTFNSNVIETMFHLVPDLADDFIYFTDDCLLGAPVSRADFYDEDGRHRIFGTWLGERIWSRVFQDPFLSFGLLEHGPMPIHKPHWKQMLSVNKADWEQLFTHRFRQSGELAPTQFYRWFCLSQRKTDVKPEPFWHFLPKSSFVKLRNSVADIDRKLTKIREKCPKFLCLNDDLGASPSTEVIRMIRQFLESYFPESSSFEKPATSGLPSPPHSADDTTRS